MHDRAVPANLSGGRRREREREEKTDSRGGED